MNYCHRQCGGRKKEFYKSENLFHSRLNGLHERSHAAQVFYDTSDSNFHLIMKGTAVIQHLSVVNTSRRDTVVSRRGKKT